MQWIAKEPRIDEADDSAGRRQRHVGRPRVPAEIRARLKDLLSADPEAPPLEFLRQLRQEGTELGESTFYQIFRLETPVTSQLGPQRRSPDNSAKANK